MDFDNLTVEDLQIPHKQSFIWTSIMSLVDLLVESLGDDMSNVNDLKLDRPKIIYNLNKCINPLLVHIREFKTLPSDFTNIAAKLGSFLLIDTSTILEFENLKQNIISLLELVWSTKDSCSDTISAYLFPHLLSRSLSINAIEKDVKRVYSYKDMLCLFDFQDSSISSVVNLVHRCLISPKYLKTNEGRSFLSFVISLNDDLRPSLMDVMRTQLSTPKISVSRSYGDIILRAWGSFENQTPQSPEINNPIEEILQDFIHMALHTSSQKCFLGIAHMLSFLHESKNVAAISQLIIRLYGPILWRSLSVSNAIVRQRATILLYQVFPLEDLAVPEGRPTSVWPVAKQLSFQLRDDDHRVRAAAVEGVFRVLTSHWDTLTKQAIDEVLDFCLSSLSLDASSAKVRAAVLDGVRTLLCNCSASHKTLRKLFKTTKAVLLSSQEDASEKVRLAFYLLLKEMLNMRDFSPFDFLSVEDALGNLVKESSSTPIMSAISALLVGRYYPQDKDGRPNGHVQVERCLELISKDEKSAALFFGQLSILKSIGSATKLSVMLFSLIVRECAVCCAGDVSDSKNGNGSNISMKRPRDTQEAQMSQGASVSSRLNESQSHGVLRVIQSLLFSVKSKLQLSKHEQSLELLRQYFTDETFSKLFQWLLLKNRVWASHELSCAALGLAVELFSILPHLMLPFLSSTLSNRETTITGSEVAKHIWMSAWSANESLILDGESECMESFQELGTSVWKFIFRMNIQENIMGDVKDTLSRCPFSSIPDSDFRSILFLFDVLINSPELWELLVKAEGSLDTMEQIIAQLVIAIQKFSHEIASPGNIVKGDVVLMSEIFRTITSTYLLRLRLYGYDSSLSLSNLVDVSLLGISSVSKHLRSIEKESSFYKDLVDPIARLLVHTLCFSSELLALSARAPEGLTWMTSEAKKIFTSEILVIVSDIYQANCLSKDTKITSALWNALCRSLNILLSNNIAKDSCEQILISILDVYVTDKVTDVRASRTVQVICKALTQNHESEKNFKNVFDQLNERRNSPKYAEIMQLLSKFKTTGISLEN